MDYLARAFDDYFVAFLPGLGYSAALAAASLAIGFPLGISFALLIDPKRHLLVKLPSRVLVECGRGASALVIVYFTYYGLPSLGVRISGAAAAIGALAFATGAYTSVIFRAGIRAVDAGQGEAAASLGLTRAKALRLVILPQAIRIVTPALIGFGVIIFQYTSVAFAVTVPELLSRAYSAGAIAYDYGPPLYVAGTLYAIVGLTALWLMHDVERRVRRA